MTEITESCERLMRGIEKAGYAGHDPYDALKSPLFRLPFLRSNRFIRFAAQQAVKRSPVNLRPLLAVPEGKNPVTLGLCIQAYGSLAEAFPERNEEFTAKIARLAGKLELLISPGFSGACWGYDFDWQARHALILAYFPTVVATGIITNGLYRAYKITGSARLKKLCISAAGFVINDLNRFSDGETICFSYSPADHQKVFNASMKGVRILAQAFALTGDATLKETAAKAVAFVVRNQSADGSWGYSLAKNGHWSDNYHTGYVLDCLDDYAACTGDESCSQALINGFRFYRETFFDPAGAPRVYAGKHFPVDCTAAGQSLLTLTRFGEVEMAEKTARWMIANMQSGEGRFFYRRYGHRTDKTLYMRWSDAWMFAGMAALIASNKTK